MSPHDFVLPMHHESAARAALPAALPCLSHVRVGGEAAVGGAAMCNSGGRTETSSVCTTSQQMIRSDHQILRLR